MCYLNLNKTSLEQRTTEGTRHQMTENWAVKLLIAIFIGAMKLMLNFYLIHVSQANVSKKNPMVKVALQTVGTNCRAHASTFANIQASVPSSSQINGSVKGRYFQPATVLSGLSGVVKHGILCMTELLTCSEEDWEEWQWRQTQLSEPSCVPKQTFLKLMEYGRKRFRRKTQA